MTIGRKHFRTEGVVVKHPSLGISIDVLRLPIPPLVSMPTVAGGFIPSRLVINLKVVDKADPSKIVTTFDPPLEVRVRYTPGDEKDASDKRKLLNLAYWDGKKWVRFTQKDHQFKLENKPTKKYAGWGIVKITHWTDPPKAWGT